MAGKRDRGSHSAAIAKVERVLPHADVIRAHLDEILNSAAFRASNRSREFLAHVVECALSQKWERLKERSLGIDVFSREACYDTAADAIVRVAASDVRRRLAHHYSECAQAPGLRIELPAGSYIPEFDGFGGLALPRPDEQSRRMLTNDVDSDEFNAAGSIVPLASRPPALHSFRKALLLFAVVCLSWIFGVASGRLIPAGVTQTDARYQFYRELLGPIATDAGRETEIVLSKPSLYIGSNNAAHDTQAKYQFHLLGLGDQEDTGLGEAVSAFNMGELMHRIDRPIRLTEARVLNWGATRNIHLILLGAPQMNSWMQKSLLASNFAMEHDAITNYRPLPGELKSYRRSSAGSVLDDYGLIWMARSPAGSRRLLIAGLTSSGTAGAGDFFCDPDRMRPIYERLRSSAGSAAIPTDWQVLLHIRAGENVPPEVSFISLRGSSTNR